MITNHKVVNSDVNSCLYIPNLSSILTTRFAFLIGNLLLSTMVFWGQRVPWQRQAKLSGGKACEMRKTGMGGLRAQGCPGSPGRMEIGTVGLGMDGLLGGNVTALDRQDVYQYLVSNSISGNRNQSSFAQSIHKAVPILRFIVVTQRTLHDEIREASCATL
jgi:hypothetical protein